MWAEALCLGPDKTLLAQQLADFVSRHAGYDRQVEVLALQQLCRRLAMHLHLHQRMALREAREDARQKTHHIVIRGADADGANHVRLAQGAEDFAMQVENAPGIAQQYLALAIKAHLAAFASNRRRCTTSSSRRFICMLTADWVRFRCSAARVKPP